MANTHKVSIETGSDARIFSESYAEPLKVYVGDTCVYNSDDAHLASPEWTQEKADAIRRAKGGPTIGSQGEHTDGASAH